MECKRCKAALPSHGFVCLRCGALMSKEQIKWQSEYQKEMAREGNINLKSQAYNKTVDYSPKKKENKYLGALLIVVILLVLIGIAILKVMD